MCSFVYFVTSSPFCLACSNVEIKSTLKIFGFGYLFSRVDSLQAVAIIHKLFIALFHNEIIDLSTCNTYCFIINKTGLRQFSEKGKVPYEFIFKPFPEGLGLTHEEMGDKTINTDNITVFFVSNTAADKIPMTAWTIVHRVGHAMNRTPLFQDYTKWLDNEFDELLAIYGKQKVSRTYDNDYKKIRTHELAKGRLFNAIGTMRSAREGRIHLRPYEFYYELFVQYLKDGKITFKPLTKNILIGYGPYGSKSIANTQNLSEAQEKLNMIANTIPYFINDVLNANVGDIFVM